jgi:hypothetical protein
MGRIRPGPRRQWDLFDQSGCQLTDFRGYIQYWDPRQERGASLGRL